ncbi:MAG TPA: hypothetical protein VH394_25905 [Thermoanaerobaculia bacterium]|nr:hypothetical protein [Thermoanaerobaculia bacterium]
MGWDHTVREKRLAPIGEYQPQVYRVTVHDTFEQHYLQMAAGAIRNGMSVSEFLLFAARYVLRNHRDDPRGNPIQTRTVPPGEDRPQRQGRA